MPTSHGMSLLSVVSLFLVLIIQCWFGGTVALPEGLTEAYAPPEVLARYKHIEVQDELLRSHDSDDAPEQRLKADIFSLGVTFLHLIFGNVWNLAEESRLSLERFLQGEVHTSPRWETLWNVRSTFEFLMSPCECGQLMFQRVLSSR